MLLIAEMSSSFDATPRAVLRKHLVGLKNDNRKCCYLNSAVQALYSLTEYRHLMDTAVLCLRGTQLSVLRNHAPLFKAWWDISPICAACALCDLTVLIRRYGIWDVLVEELQMGFHDVALLPSPVSFCTTFLEDCGRG